MLRYVFDTTAQLARHVHRLEGAALLFFPEQSSTRHTGEPVLLEMQLLESGQQVVMRAIIHSRVEGRFPGVWLQFSDQLSRAIELDAAAIHRRRHSRISSDVMVAVRSSGAPAQVARMTDVSAGGARLGAAPQLPSGATVELQLVSALPDVPRALGHARVVRAASGEVGLQFAPDTVARVQKLVQALTAAWRSAVTIWHPVGCCVAGAPIEPPLPHARPHRARRDS